MKITMRQRDGVTILDLEGQDHHRHRATSRSAMRSSRRSTDGQIKILLNAKGVTTIDSSGIGELVAGYTTVTNRGGKLKLCNLPPKVQDILQVTQLITVFEVFEDEDEAVRSFA